MESDNKPIKLLEGDQPLSLWENLSFWLFSISFGLAIVVSIANGLNIIPPEIIPPEYFDMTNFVLWCVAGFSFILIVVIIGIGVDQDTKKRKAPDLH